MGHGSPVFAVVDLETTGLDPATDRILEIGMVLVHGRRIGRRFSTLVNPRRRVSPWIFQLTGIDPEAVATAPDFEEVSSTVLSILDQADYFVAHNARFDYGFVRAELERLGRPFRKNTLCTVRLGRKIYPEVGRYSLDRMIEHFGLVCERRHRALDDALAAAELLRLYQNRKTAWSEAVGTTQREAALPELLRREDIEAIPNTVGVYVFYDARGLPIYVGKSVAMRDRIMGHFTSDLRQSRERRIKQETVRVETVPTASELGALLLESSLVKELAPFQNRALRRTTQFLAVRLVADVFGYERCEVAEMPAPDGYGPFRSRRSLQAYLDLLVKSHNLCATLLGLEPPCSGGCFRRQIGRCAGACEGAERPEDHNARLRDALCRLRLESEERDAFALLEPTPDGRRELFVLRPPYLLQQRVIDSEDFDWDAGGTPRVLDVDAWKIIRRHMSRHRERILSGAARTV
jgi:DNA polymerase-3 subunit epsilon